MQIVRGPDGRHQVIDPRGMVMGQHNSIWSAARQVHDYFGGLQGAQPLKPVIGAPVGVPAPGTYGPLPGERPVAPGPIGPMPGEKPRPVGNVPLRTMPIRPPMMNPLGHKWT